MRILLQACRQVLVNAAALPAVSGGPPVTLTPDKIRVGHISGIANPETPLITLDRLGGSSVLPVGGWDEPLLTVQTWSRLNMDEAIALYEWVSMQLNQRNQAITTQMALIGPSGGSCLFMLRQWEGYSQDDLGRWWYVTARYYSKAIDYSDLHAAYGQG